MPHRVVLDITRRCNLRCSMCHTWKTPRGPELSAAEIAAVLADCPSLVWLDVTGGEPFVRHDIADVFAGIVAAAPSLAMLHFQTNGWHTDRIAAVTRALRARMDPGCDLVVTVSIDGTEPVHDAIRGRDGSYARAIATAQRLMATAGVDVHIGTTVGSHNADDLDALWTALQRDLPHLQRRRWHLNAVQASRHFYGDVDVERLRLRGTAPLQRHLVARGMPRTMTEWMESLYLFHLGFVQRGEASGIPCQALRSTVFVSPEGDVFPCHIYDRPLGNVREIDLATLWHSAKVARARDDIERLACGGCFSACEAYPAIAGAPLRTAAQTMRRAVRWATDPR